MKHRISYIKDSLTLHWLKIESTGQGLGVGKQKEKMRRERFIKGIIIDIIMKAYHFTQQKCTFSCRKLLHMLRVQSHIKC